MVVAALVLLAPSGAFAQQSAAIQTWQQNLSNAPPTQPGCYEADYPGTWRQVVCVKNQSSQPNVPMSLPPPTSNGNVPAGIIGDGTDYAAKVPATNPIASVVGSFVDVTGVNSVASYYINENGQNISKNNMYSIQINSNQFDFSGALCKSSTGTCKGWQQFIYSSEPGDSTHSPWGWVHIQYWIYHDANLNGNDCPSSWAIQNYPSGQNKGKFWGCWFEPMFNTDSSISPVQGATYVLPAIAPANLGNVVLVGKTSGATDAAILFSAGKGYANVNRTIFPDLSRKWTDAEFNIFGYNGTYLTAAFNPGAKMTVKTAVNNGTGNAPACFGPTLGAGATGEKSGLYFNSPCCPYSGASPAIAFTQSTSNGMSLSCPAISGSTVASAYTVSASVNPSAAATLSPASFQVPQGSSVLFTVTRQPGYDFIGFNYATGNATVCPWAFLDKPTDNVWRFSIGPITGNCSAVGSFSGGPTYTVTASAGTGGSISPSGAVSVTSGATKAFTLTPNAGYTLSSVGGTCGGTISGNTYTTRAITANCTVTAAFSATTYVVSASAGTGGTISNAGAVSVTPGATKTYTITPSSGYTIASVGGTCGGTLNGNTYTTRAITASCTVTAAFTPVASYTVTSSAGTGGSINPAGSFSVTSGATRSYTVTPNSGYTIGSVGGTCGGTLSGNTFTTRAVTANCTVTAAFTPVTTNYTVTSSAGTNGIINPTGSVSVTSGTTRTYTITPNPGYIIGSVGGTCGGTLSGHTYTTQIITNNCTITAAFTLDPNSHTVTASAGTGGSISPAGSAPVTSGTIKFYTLTPNAGYIIGPVGGTCRGTLSGNTYTIQGITANCTITATFTQVATSYTITSSASTGGSISPAGGVSVVSGATKVYTVTPNLGYTIGSVGGTCGGTLSGNTYTTKAITANCTVTATFVLTTYSVTPGAGTGGIISPLGTASVFAGATKTYTIVPNSGYAIGPVGGTCGGTLSGNTFTTKPITANCTVTATFTPVTTSYTVTSSTGTGGSISPAGSFSVTSGATRSYTLTPNSGYTIGSVGGTCGGTLSGNIYTTRAITANCTVTAAFTPVTTYYTVTSSAGTGGSISPSGNLSVTSGTVRTYTITPNSGYTIGSVGGTCGGTLSGNIYTTRAITANCTVTAAFTPVTTYTVSSVAGGGGTISPAGDVSVVAGATKVYTITPNSTYVLASMGGTCGGTLSGNTYTTNPITGNCTVSAKFAATYTFTVYTVTASAGTGGSISPAGALSTTGGSIRSFTVTPNAGWAIASVGGTCGGTLSGNTYTTRAIAGDCTVTATFR